MDPVETKDTHVLEARDQAEQTLEALDPSVSIHDFRTADGKEQVNLIFDMVVPYEYDKKKQDELRTTLIKLLQIPDPRY